MMTALNNAEPTPTRRSICPDADAWTRKTNSRRAADVHHSTSTKANACWNAASGIPVRSKASLALSPEPTKKTLKTARSSRLRSILKSDLRMRSQSPNRLEDDDGNVKSRRQKLEEYQNDIEQLLTSLHSTEFVGKIDPKYHSKYMSTPSF
mmetsp:Transcript_3197/g.6014  ORF Transcript_3197/g.6014 Transcript_3197/m.6014 type:complete len:151 (-) Transcript_3197:23-475(-)